MGDTTKFVEINRAKVSRDFNFPTDKQPLANQTDIVVVEKEQKTTVAIDVGVTADSNIRKNEHEKIGKCQRLKKQLELMWKAQSKVVPVVTGVLEALMLKLEEWLQQILGTTSKIYFQKSAVLETGKNCDPMKNSCCIAAANGGLNRHKHKDTMQNPQTPKPLVEDLSFSEKGDFKYMYIYLHILFHTYPAFPSFSLCPSMLSLSPSPLSSANSRVVSTSPLLVNSTGRGL